ncbi:hypothetical protein TNCV_4960921 [Trichonephila clavipes]|uniref:Uncharacterized protein n=1 Tax=Trichonephila clavipes TaxID=2585209 RepID=A0A8X6SR62_TRICX|nr:hypothetical protein TNCV_4960921 [Trichonephila clavipes]
MGKRERKGIPRIPFSSLRDASNRKDLSQRTNGVSQKSRREKNSMNGTTRKRVENRERSLEFPGVVTPVSTKDSKPLEKEKDH